MKYTREQFEKDGWCDDGRQYVESIGYDFEKFYNEKDAVDWIIKLLVKSGNLTKRLAVHMALNFDRDARPGFLKFNTEDGGSLDCIHAAEKWMSGLSNESDCANAAMKSSLIRSAALIASMPETWCPMNELITSSSRAATYRAHMRFNDTESIIDLVEYEFDSQLGYIRRLIPNPF